MVDVVYGSDMIQSYKFSNEDFYFHQKLSKINIIIDRYSIHGLPEAVPLHVFFVNLLLFKSILVFFKIL